MSRRLLLAVALLAWLACLFAVPSALATDRLLGVSPHNKPDACRSCHDASAGPAPGAVRPVEATCRTCHPDANMHPVGMRPKDVKVAVGWPLENGMVTCATCHAEPSCDPDRDRGAPFLRGGTPDRRMDFCYRCHDVAALARSNPHQAPAAAGAPDPNCAACHSGLPPVGAAPIASRLRLAPKDACSTCHPGPVHAGAAEHTAAIQRSALGVAGVGQLPLLDDGRIACWTCHDVHKVEPVSSKPEPYRPGPMLALPTEDDRLCRACHGDGP